MLMLSKVASSTTFSVFGMIRSRIEPWSLLIRPPYIKVFKFKLYAHDIANVGANVNLTVIWTFSVVKYISYPGSMDECYFIYCISFNLLLLALLECDKRFIQSGDPKGSKLSKDCAKNN